MFGIRSSIRQDSRVVFRFSANAFLLTVVSSFGYANPASERFGGPYQGERDVRVLELRKPIDRELVGDQSHSYNIALRAAQYLHIVVDQRGIDVVVTLFGPDGKKLTEVDSPNGTQGPEPVSLIAEFAGSYRLEVRSPDKTAAAGRYEVKIDELRRVTGQDKTRVAAERAFAHAMLLVAQGTAESLQSAIKKFEESALLSHSSSDAVGEASTLAYIGRIYNSLGEKQKALDYLARALPLRRALRDRGGEGTTLNDIGAVYNTLGQKQKALDHYEQALPLLRGVGDRIGEATTLDNIGKVYALAEKQKALDYFAQALPLWRAVGERRGEATTLSNIGVIYDSLGEKQKALDYYAQALPVVRAVGNRQGEAVMLSNIGMVYDSLGEKQKALDYYAQALPSFRVIGDRRGEGITLVNIGLVYYSLGEKQKALDYYTQALPLSRAIGDPIGEATILDNMGSVYASLGQRQKALEYHEQSLPLFRVSGDRNGEGTALNNIAFIYHSSGEKQKALDYYTRALSFLHDVGNRYGEATTLSNMAVLERDRGNLTEALKRIEAALTIVESLRTKIGSQGLRSSYFATVQDDYGFFIDLLMRLHKQKPTEGYDSKALQASERGRARSLLETLAEANADIRQGVDSKLLERERALQRKLNAKAQEQMKQLSGPQAQEQAKAIAQEIEALTTEFQQVETEIRQTSPRYAALTQPQPLSVKEIQTQVLDQDTLLLEYSLGTEHSYLWAVTPSSITSYELPKREEIEAAARQVYAMVTDAKQWKANAAAGRQLTREAAQTPSSPEAAIRLSQMLLAPVASQLGNKRLLIVADGALAYIPFAALPIRVGGGAGRSRTTGRPPSVDKYAPLVVEHEIVSLPSASTLAVIRREVKDRKPAEKTMAVLADPVFERNDERVKQTTGASTAVSSDNPPGASSRALVIEKAAMESGLKGADLKIPRLPGTRREAAEILALVPTTESKQAFDFVASRQTATSADLSQYRYVHFATHGFLDSLHPELSGLVLSMVDQNGNPQEGFLRAHEVFNLKLPAELVVLSACQTGLGKEVKGEGLVSLTRGFMYAGAPRVVVSLWSVNDEATAELMVRFYRGMLKDNLRPAAALRAAQISLMKERAWKAPFYWAAFTMQGEWH